MFSAPVLDAFRQVAVAHGLPPAALIAVAMAECDGRVTETIDGRDVCPMRYEFHVFHRLLRPAARNGAIGLGLASTRWGLLRYPPRLREHYALLARARRIDEAAALGACAWGVGRVLGEDAGALGYDGAAALAEDAQAGPAGQARVMALHLRHRGLADALHARAWTEIARSRRGRTNAPEAYADRLARAHARAGAALAATETRSVADVIRLGRLNTGA